jgi:uncharacterized protein YebE (UPF0316 family)
MARKDKEPHLDKQAVGFVVQTLAHSIADMIAMGFTDVNVISKPGELPTITTTHNGRTHCKVTFVLRNRQFVISYEESESE